MNSIEDLRQVDSQSVFTVRFGFVQDDGTTEWADPQKVRFLPSEKREEDGWLVTPMTPEGRPLGYTFEGDTAQNGILGSTNTNHVMQILPLVEASVLRRGYENEDIEEALGEVGLEKSSLSPLGRVFCEAFTKYKKDTSDEVFELMLDVLGGKYDV